MTMSRIVQWKEHCARVGEIPLEGQRDQLTGYKCECSAALVFSGHGKTGGSGEWHVDLSVLSCFLLDPNSKHRPSVVATPATDHATEGSPQPYLLAVHTKGTKVTIYSYRPDGTTAPGVEFAWHCIVEVPPQG